MFIKKQLIISGILLGVFSPLAMADINIADNKASVTQESMPIQHFYHAPAPLPAPAQITVAAMPQVIVANTEDNTKLAHFPDTTINEAPAQPHHHIHHHLPHHLAHKAASNTSKLAPSATATASTTLAKPAATTPVVSNPAATILSVSPQHTPATAKTIAVIKTAPPAVLHSNHSATPAVITTTTSATLPHASSQTVATSAQSHSKALVLATAAIVVPATATLALHDKTTAVTNKNSSALVAVNTKTSPAVIVVNNKPNSSMTIKTNTPVAMCIPAHKPAIIKHIVPAINGDINAIPNMNDEAPVVIIHHFPHHYYAPKPHLHFSVQEGSLHDNVDRIVRLSHWGKLVWNLPYDYRWVGSETIAADNVQDALNQLLASYPLQAVFYDANHIVAIQSRVNH